MKDFGLLVLAFLAVLFLILVPPRVSQAIVAVSAVAFQIYVLWWLVHRLSS